MKNRFISMNRKLMVVIGLFLIIMVAIAATTPPPNKNNFINLKVLPQDISKDVLMKIMKEFNSSLGVHCNYCHAEKDTAHHLDFASDSNHVKDGARYMMKMTMQINKEYLQVKQPLIGDSSLARPYGWNVATRFL